MQEEIFYYDKTRYGRDSLDARLQKARGPSAILRGENNDEWKDRIQTEVQTPISKEYMHEVTVRRATERKLGKVANQVGAYLEGVVPKEMGFKRAEAVVTTLTKIPHWGTVPVGAFKARKKDGTWVALLASIANFQADVDTSTGMPKFKNMPSVKDGEDTPGMYIGTAWSLKPDGTLDKIDPELGTDGVMFTTANPAKLAEFYCGLAGLKPIPPQNKDLQPPGKSRPLSGLREEVETHNQRIQAQPDRVVHRAARAFAT